MDFGSFGDGFGSFGVSTDANPLRHIEDIPDNFVENTFFDEDTHYPHSQWLRNRSDWYNGAIEGTALGVKTPAHWRLFSPLYTTAPPTDYTTARGLAFQDVGSGYQDLAIIAAPTRPASPTDYETYSPSLRKRITKLFGIGDELITYNADNTARTFNAASADSPIMSVCEDLSTIPTFPSDKCWVKYEIWSDQITIPADAITCKYGAYVRCPSHDMFRDDNFGGIYAQQLNRLSSINDNAYTDFIAFHKDGNQPNLFTGTIGNSDTLPLPVDSAKKAQYYWGGLASDQSTTGYNVNSFLQANTISGGYENAKDYSSFRKVEKSAPLGGSDYDYINIGLYFCENQDNLDNSGTPTGSIEIYQPYIQFFDSGGNRISS